MNVLQRILGLDDSRTSGKIALICTILCALVFVASQVGLFDRRTQGYINLYLFYPILIVGLVNSVNTIAHQTKIKDTKSATFFYALPIPLYLVYLLIRITINW
ncbi:MAG: hypothetical protein IM602_10650 [Cytophagales bacterium]|nr:hypothetical protein [Cytophagales bacterium]MCA6426096.1 hypothetical protein [Cytophagales bacterium]